MVIVRKPEPAVVNKAWDPDSYVKFPVKPSALLLNILDTPGAPAGAVVLNEHWALELSDVPINEATNNRRVKIFFIKDI